MHLYEGSIRPVCVVAAVLWLAGWGTVVFDLFLAHDDIGHLGLGLMASAIILQIRGYYLSIRKRFDDHQLAFEMGKEVAQRPRPVR